MDIEELKQFEFLKGLTQEELEIIRQRLIIKEVKENNIIFREDTPADALYLVASGRIRIFKEKGSAHLPTVDKKTTLAILEKGELFGEMSIFDKCLRSASAEAMCDSTLLSIKRKDFEELIQTQPQLALKLAIATIRILSKRLRWMDAKIL